MASQEKKEKEVGGEQGKVTVEKKEKEKEQNSSGSPVPERVPEWAEQSRRIGPWHPPDFQRQRALANRLSNPALRSSRPATSPEETPHNTSFPSLQHSPYHHPSSSRSNSNNNNNNNNNNKMNSHRASSGPPSSPRAAAASPRRQAPPTTSHSSSSSYSASPRYGGGAASPRRQPPLFITPATSRKVTEDELDVIVDRVTKPTVSSRGGVDLQNKDFTYIPTPRLKTLPVVPGLDRRYLGLQRVDSARMEEIVLRLTRMTSASKAKFAPNKNVYVDMEPGAHMVSQRSVQSAAV